MFQQAPRGEAAEFLEELRAEELRRVGVGKTDRLGFRFVLQAAGDDQARFFRRATFEQRHGSRLFDAVEIGLRECAANLAVEIIQARNNNDGVGQAVGDLDEIADRLLKALFGVIEEAEIFDLIDSEDEGGLLDGPNQLSERGDDFEGAVLARVGIEGGDGLMGERRELAAIEILAHALIDAWVAALQVKQRADDIDVEVFVGELGRGDDVVS